MKQAAVVALIAVFAGAASIFWAGPVPGDLAITQFLQKVFGEAPSWAQAITSTAVMPLALATLALGIGLGWPAAGLRAALAVPLAYGFAFAVDKALRAILFVPRPAAEQVAVSAPSVSSGLPSTFGMVYGAAFGLALLAPGSTPTARLIAAGLLLAGGAARVVLGGHWASQLVASSALGLMLALFAAALAMKIPSISAGK